MRISKVKKLITLLLVLCMISLLLVACNKSNNINTDDIYVLFTGDVHCADDENIGYTGLASYKKQLEEQSDFVALVDTGDAIQGDFTGMSSKGQNIIDLMNMVGYDYAVLGNHEFDYGMDQLSKLIDRAEFQYLGANIKYTGKNTNKLEKLEPYSIMNFGKVKVGFVGVTTPLSITSSTPTYFMEDDEYVYDFYQSNDGQNFYNQVQSTVDACRKDGADYVVVLAHLGDDDTYAPYSSRQLIENTNGIDVVLDGHAHNVVSSDYVSNNVKKLVPLSSTGTKLQNIGQLVISSSGNISVGYVSKYEAKDKTIADKINAFDKEYEALLQQKVAASDFALSITDESGIRLVRTRETAIGNMVADAFRREGNADIALINGGGLRASLPQGNVTYGDVMKLMPYQNTFAVVKATGQEIADALEFSYRVVQSVTSQNGVAVGESGGFFQVAGIKFTVNTKTQTSVKEDENGMFVSVEGARRVENIQVLGSDGKYYPLDVKRTYTVASTSYTLINMGDGFSMFADNDFVITEGKVDMQVVLDYIKYMGDKIDAKYASLEGRITIK